MCIRDRPIIFKLWPIFTGNFLPKIIWALLEKKYPNDKIIKELMTRTSASIDKSLAIT